MHGSSTWNSWRSSEYVTPKVSKILNRLIQRDDASKSLVWFLFFLDYFWSRVLLLTDSVKDGHSWCENLPAPPTTNNRFCHHETEVWFKKWRFPMPCAVNFSWRTFCSRRRCSVLVLRKNGFEGKWRPCSSHTWPGYFSTLVILRVILELSSCLHVSNLRVQLRKTSSGKYSIWTRRARLRKWFKLPGEITQCFPGTSRFAVHRLAERKGFSQVTHAFAVRRYKEAKF